MYDLFGPEFERQFSIFTSYQCDNAFLFSKIAAIYFKPGFKICDSTYGKGVFWKNIDISLYELYASDIITTPDTLYDFCNLPYDNEFFDIYVFDPPYVHNPGNMIVNDNYKNKETTKGFYHKDIINLYRKGMIEGKRVLKHRGLMLVKCKDEIESSLQKMSHIEIYNIAINELLLEIEDFFVLLQKTNPTVQVKLQKHARKNHSYFWIFRK